MKKHRLADFSTDYVDIPDRPDIEKLIVLPLKTIYINLNADADADIIWLVYDLEQSLPFEASFASLLW